MNTQLRLARYQLTHVTDWLESLDPSTSRAEEEERIEDLLGDEWSPFEEISHCQGASTAGPGARRLTDYTACPGTETQTQTQSQKEFRYGHD